MKNLAKFLVFVLLLSAGISLLRLPPQTWRLKGSVRAHTGEVHICGRASGQSKTGRVARIIESGTARAGEERRAIGRSGKDNDQGRYST